MKFSKQPYLKKTWKKCFSDLRIDAVSPRYDKTGTNSKAKQSQAACFSFVRCCHEGIYSAVPLWVTWKGGRKGPVAFSLDECLQQGLVTLLRGGPLYEAGLTLQMRLCEQGMANETNHQSLPWKKAVAYAKRIRLAFTLFATEASPGADFISLCGAVLCTALLKALRSSQILKWLALTQFMSYHGHWGIMHGDLRGEVAHTATRYIKSMINEMPVTHARPSSGFSARVTEPGMQLFEIVVVGDLVLWRWLAVVLQRQEMFLAQ